VPLDLHYSKGRVKISVGLAKGKKQFDKRETEKERDWEREKARLIRAKADGDSEFAHAHSRRSSASAGWQAAASPKICGPAPGAGSRRPAPWIGRIPPGPPATGDAGRGPPRSARSRPPAHAVGQAATIAPTLSITSA
jgi:hypothetical protein